MVRILQILATSALLLSHAGIVQSTPVDNGDAKPTPGCTKNACLKAVIQNRSLGSVSGYRGCTSFLRQTVTPPVQTRKVTQKVTAHTTITVTKTDIGSGTVTATVTKTKTVKTKAITTVTVTPKAALEARDEEAGSSCPATPAPPKTLPSYARACSNTVAYASACHCVGVKASTITKKPCITTLTVKATTTQIQTSTKHLTTSKLKTVKTTTTKTITVTNASTRTVTAKISSTHKTKTTASKTSATTKSPTTIPVSTTTKTSSTTSTATSTAPSVTTSPSPSCSAAPSVFKLDVTGGSYNGVPLSAGVLSGSQSPILLPYVTAPQTIAQFSMDSSGRVCEADTSVCLSTLNTGDGTLFLVSTNLITSFLFTPVQFHLSNTPACRSLNAVNAGDKKLAFCTLPGLGGVGLVLTDSQGILSSCQYVTVQADPV